MSNYPLYVGAALYNESQEIGAGKYWVYDSINGEWCSIDVVNGVFVVRDGDNNNITPGGGGGTPSVITVANQASDTTCFVCFFTAATGDLGPKTNAALTYNAVTGALACTTFVGALTGNATSVTTNANLTGHVTSTGNATVLGSFTKAQLDGAVSDGDVMYVGDAPTGISKAALLATTPTATSQRYRVTDATPAQREAYPDGTLWRYVDNNEAVDETLLTYTPTGTTQTVTLATGPIQMLDLGSATGTVAVTLTRPGRSTGHLILKQGATPRAITVTLSAGTLVTLGTAVVLSSDGANSRRIFAWSCDGTDLILAPSEVSV